MPPTNLATAADYADALLIARRAKNVLFFLLLIVLLVEIGIFVLARMTSVLDAPAKSGLPAATQPATTTRPVLSKVSPELARKAVQYVTGLMNFAGMALVLMLAAVLMLIIKIMLVGRLVGVAAVTSSWLWCVLLAILLFPWQAFLNNANFDAEFKIPGVLYTFSELTHPTAGAKFSTSTDLPTLILRWARFIGFPVLSVILLMVVQVKSRAGMLAAMGEGDYDVPDSMRLS